MNPFKFGTIVENDFFTDRVVELERVKQLLDSENHLVLISPRRFGKSSLISKALKQLERPAITIDFMKVLSIEDLAGQILKHIFSLYKMEKIKHLLSNFRIAPMISYSTPTDSWDVSFMPAAGNSDVALEDSMELLAKISSPSKRLIVVFDEFQEVDEIDKTLSRQLRSIIQRQSGLNYIFMGSQESMMEEIFEKKKSPFYHFGQRMNLGKIPHDDFLAYIADRLPEKKMQFPDRIKIAEQILLFTQSHPYYTQQLASTVYNLIEYNNQTEQVVETAIKIQIEEHDLDYERLWQTLNRTDRKIILQLSLQKNPLLDRNTATSTSFSALKRLVKKGLVNKVTTYELEDPFFGRWVKRI